MPLDNKQASKSPVVLSARVGDLAPLVEKWIDDNPKVNVSHLVRDGLKLALKPYAGKKYAHLVEAA